MEQDIIIQYLQDPMEVGRLIVREGKVFFEGNADESARVFFRMIQKEIDEYIIRHDEKKTVPK